MVECVESTVALLERPEAFRCLRPLLEVRPYAAVVWSAALVPQGGGVGS